MNDKGFRFKCRVGRVHPDGKHYSLGFGVRVGYWPCLKGPYIQVSFARWRYELWWGLAHNPFDDREEI